MRLGPREGRGAAGTVSVAEDAHGLYPGSPGNEKCRSAGWSRWMALPTLSAVAFGDLDVSSMHLIGIAEPDAVDQREHR